MSRKPNLVYILADDMGYGDVSCLNENAAFKTPYLDRLAREGIAFADAHSSSAVCTPSRYSILTGRYNWRSQLKSGVLNGYSPPLIEKDRKTVAHLLKEQGYATACIGKWHLGLDWGTVSGAPLDASHTDAHLDVDFSKPIQNGPTTCGFDAFYGISASLDMPPYVYIDGEHVSKPPDHQYQGYPGNVNGRPEPRFSRSGPCAPDFRHEEVLPHLIERAVDYIQAHKDEPFFLYFPLPAPHTPILPAPQYQGKSGTNAYGDFCLMVDGVVGQIMDALKACDIEEDTILLFTSDNGCSPQADFTELASFGHNPSSHFRGHKADIYEGGHRIPLMIRWPHGIPGGRLVHETVCLTDLMATMSELMDLPLPDDMGEDSVSNLYLWQNASHEAPVREATVHQSIDGSLSIRKGGWKLELCPGSGGWSPPRPGRDDTTGMPSFQLYHLDSDIGETNNLIGIYPERFKELKAHLIRIITDGRSTPGSPQKNDGAPVWETIAWLEAESKGN